MTLAALICAAATMGGLALQLFRLGKSGPPRFFLLGHATVGTLGLGALGVALAQGQRGVLPALLGIAVAAAIGAYLLSRHFRGQGVA